MHFAMLLNQPDTHAVAANVSVWDSVMCNTAAAAAAAAAAEIGKDKTFKEVPEPAKVPLLHPALFLCLCCR
jgi:hypothetical protein